MQQPRRAVGEAQGHRLAARPAQGMFGRLAQDRRPERVGDDEAGIGRSQRLRQGVGDREEQAVAIVAIIRPFPVGPEIRDARLDLHDGQPTGRAQGDQVRPPAIGQGEFRDRDMAEFGEKPAHSALHVQRRWRLPAVRRQDHVGEGS